MTMNGGFKKMKSETILNKLIKLKEKPYDAELLDSIINELKIDVYNKQEQKYKNLIRNLRKQQEEKDNEKASNKKTDSN